MSTLQQLLEQQAELNAAIEKTRGQERAATIRVVKLLVEQHGLTAADLGAKVGPKKGGTVVAKYRDPETGATWSGRGLKPRWLNAALQAGRQIGDFAI